MENSKDKTFAIYTKPTLTILYLDSIDCLSVSLEADRDTNLDGSSLNDFRWGDF